MKPIIDKIKEKPWLGWVIFISTVILVFFLSLLASSILDRRAEADFAFSPKVDYDDTEPRNALWGKIFPREYESYMQTADTSFKSKYNGNAEIDMLETDPRLVVLWAGYGFSKEYKQARGHYWAIEDIRATLRTGAPSKGNPSPQPNTCWTCKSPDVPRLMKQMGSKEFYKGSWDTKGAQIVNHIGCADCHDAKTMNLIITRPALVEAFQRQGKDIKKATHQEMRSLVCAQCHVEYYFDKHKYEGIAYLTFPWDKGNSVDSIEKYYDQINFSDWTHPLSKAPMLKAQHPDYELFTKGIHYDKGLACADCHMPYKSEGGQKFTDHHIQSPLNNVTNSCQVCHRDDAKELIEEVYERQDKIIENRDLLEEILVKAHIEAKAAWDNAATEEEMKPVLQLIRHAQWRWDFSAAGHGNSFHAPIEIGRMIASGINKAQEARLLLSKILSKHGFDKPVAYPDLSTKAKAQDFIKLDLNKMKAEKQTFMQTVVPVWLQEAAKREAGYKGKM